MIKNIVIASLAVLLVVSGFFFSSGKGVGGTTNVDFLGLSGLTLGSTGTIVSKIIAPANCTVIANANTIAATSTKDVDCAVTGMVATDDAIVFATSTPSTVFGGLSIMSSRASTTAAFATFTLYNGTGGTFTWTSAASTSFDVIGVQ